MNGSYTYFSFENLILNLEFYITGVSLQKYRKLSSNVFFLIFKLLYVWVPSMRYTLL